MKNQNDMICPQNNECAMGKLTFISEETLANTLPTDYWVNMGCGNQCCQCNSMLHMQFTA